ncbi:PIR protein, putative [Plasmodium sp. DRC-Itaito]|nr:PIR protein, putative [Plasmodium sp. DRC-Itaito]
MFNYTNILLFSLSLNILLLSSEINNQKYHKPTVHASSSNAIKPHRSLCECELYSPANYDNDPEMNCVMQNFNKQTQRRFHEYDERMKTTRQKCKDRCDKEIQKIILKDKLEKQMAQQLTTLETDIQNDAIPTCICEKSMADKVEKGCLRCGGILGSAVPELGAIGATALYTLSQWQTRAIAAAITAAKQAGSAAGIKAGEAAGKNLVIKFLKEWGVEQFCPDLLESIGTKIPYTDITNIANSIYVKYSTSCSASVTKNPICDVIATNLKLIPNGSYNPLPTKYAIPKIINGLVEKAKTTAKGAAEAARKSVTSEITKKQSALLEAEFNSSISSINASIIAIVVIVLIMVIIYLILRYRRKKKMKKKLQYIKLLEE